MRGPGGEHRFAGAIDFDHCKPGPRLWDLAYTAYRFVPLMPAVDEPVTHSSDERAPFGWSAQKERLWRFLAAYAAYGQPISETGVSDLLNATLERLENLAAFSDEVAARLEKPELARHAAMYRRHAQWLRSRAG